MEAQLRSLSFAISRAVFCLGHVASAGFSDSAYCRLQPHGQEKDLQSMLHTNLVSTPEALMERASMSECVAMST